MLFAAGRSGLVGLLILIAVLYYSGAGSWVLTRVKHLDEACYGAVASHSWASSLANPVCGSIAKGFAAVETAAANVQDRFDQWRQGVVGNSMGKLDSYTNALRDRFGSLASSQQELAQMIKSGPRLGTNLPAAAQFQQAIDSFAIGQLYMKDSATMTQALPWLQYGAAQPQGFGVASQLTLGNLYAQGGPGVPANPQLAQSYLEQAKNSIGILSSSNTQQSQQLLQTLPASPDVLAKQLERTIRDLRASVNK